MNVPGTFISFVAAGDSTTGGCQSESNGRFPTVRLARLQRCLLQNQHHRHTWAPTPYSDAAPADTTANPVTDTLTHAVSDTGSDTV